MQQAVVTVLKLRETTKKMITKFTLASFLLSLGSWWYADSRGTNKELHTKG